MPILDLPPDESQDSDNAIVEMLNMRLLQDNLMVLKADDGVHVCDLTDESDMFGKVIGTYPSRVTAYRAAVEFLIELSIDAWDKGGEE